MSFTTSFSTGMDATVDLYDPQDGSLTTITGLTSFEATARTSDLEHHGNDGTDRFATVYMGWNLTFEYDRVDGRLDRYFAERERRYRAREPQGVITITQTIQELDGSITQFRYTRVEIKQESAGSYAREAKVSGRVTGMAGLRERIA